MKQLIALLIASTLPLTALAQATDCKTDQGVATAQAKIDEALKRVGDDQGARQARLESDLKAKGAAPGWSKERQAEALKKALSSKEYWAFENEKRPHVAALMNAVLASSGPDARTSKCEAATQVKSLAGKILDVNARQYGQVAREIGLTASAAK